MPYNELGETTFPDPESQRDFRDWHGVCGCKRVTERECGGAQARPQVPKRSVSPLLCAGHFYKLNLM